MVPEIRTETWDCVKRTIAKLRVAKFIEAPYIAEMFIMRS